ncbi:unnamed protein product [Mytilus coruscus]|uniref:Endonuclease/exonuclease/phosphatase domain-containing protein n=1 Tax=Mytilus coruscus TaxID=42192 RepID=A0A6J8ED98_MYTCO|nr:unnamed protein product [Mytilus coruscus]
MPRGYGGVDILWKKKIDHVIKPIDLGSERIQCIEIKENSKSNILLTSVYLPAKGSKNHLSEYQDVIDQLYELYQKYHKPHKIIIGGDTNEDLNVQTGTKRNLYLRDFINEYGLKYDNKAKTFVNSIGQEFSEIDYFMHNLADQDFQAKQVLNELIENTSDHHPIRMSIKFKYKSAEVNRKQNNSMIKKKVNWDKVDEEWYSAHIDSLQINENMEETAVEEAILKLCELLRETADLTSSSKAIFNAKPKLKVWTPEIQVVLKTARKKYKVWKNHGKPNNKNNKMLMEKKQSKKDFRRAVRIELAKQKSKEKETILETRTKDAKMFHKLVRNNRKKGNDAIMELEVNGKKYVENDNIINGFQEHLAV